MFIRNTGRRVEVSKTGVTSDSIALAKKGCLYSIFAEIFNLNVNVTLGGSAYSLNKSSLRKWLARRGVSFSQKKDIEQLIKIALKRESGVRHKASDRVDLPPFDASTPRNNPAWTPAPINPTRDEQTPFDDSAFGNDEQSFQDQMPEPEMVPPPSYYSPSKLPLFDGATVPDSGQRSQVRNPISIPTPTPNAPGHNGQLPFDESKIGYDNQTFEKWCKEHPEAKKHVQALKPATLNRSLKWFDATTIDYLSDEQIKQLDCSETHLWGLFGGVNCFNVLFETSRRAKERVALLSPKQLVECCKNSEKGWQDHIPDEKIPLLNMELLYSTCGLFSKAAHAKRRVQLLRSGQIVKGLERGVFSSTVWSLFSAAQLEDLLKIQLSYTNEEKLKQELSKRQRMSYGEMIHTLTDEQIPQIDMENLCKSEDDFKKMFINHARAKARVSLLNPTQVLQAYRGMRWDTEKLLDLLTNDQFNQLSEALPSYQKDYRFKEVAANRQELEYEQMSHTLTDQQIPQIDMEKLCKVKNAFSHIFINHPKAKERTGLLTDKQIWQAYEGSGRDKYKFLKNLTLPQLKKLSAANDSCRQDIFIEEEIRSHLEERYRNLDRTLTDEQIPHLDMEELCQVREAFINIFINNPQAKKRVGKLKDTQVLHAFSLIGLWNQDFLLKLLTDLQLKKLMEKVTDFIGKFKIEQEYSRRGLGAGPSKTKPSNSKPYEAPRPDYKLKDLSIPSLDLKSAGATQFQALYGSIVKAHKETQDYEGVFGCSRGCGSKAINDKARKILFNLHPDRQTDKSADYVAITMELFKLVCDLRDKLIEEIDAGHR